MAFAFEKPAVDQEAVDFAELLALSMCNGDPVRITDCGGANMTFTIQIFHPESGFYFNTNHESDDLESLKALLRSESFAGPRFQIVDDNGRIRYGPVSQERSAPMTVEDFAKLFGVPVVDPSDLGLTDDGYDD